MKLPNRITITNVNIGIIFMGIFAFCYGASSTYIGAMLTTIEKRFEFTSFEMGMLMGANDIGYILCVVFIAYIGSRKGRQPFVLCMSAVGMWLSSMVYTLPYYIYGSKYEPEALLSYNFSIGPKPYCDLLNDTKSNMTRNIIDSNEITQSQKSIVMLILMIAGILTGIASTPFWNVGISFLDDMAGPEKSGVYISILYGTRSCSPIVGFLIGSQVLKYHESMKMYIDQYLPGQKDIRWIGAWWFGWLLMGFAVLATAPFLLLLRARPKKEPEANSSQQEDLMKPETSNTEKKSKESVILSSLKELVQIIGGALKNRIYLTLILGMIFEILSFVCLFTFFTKYLEYHYRVSATMTNIYTSLSLAGSSVISAAISGIVSYCIKMNIRTMNGYHAVVNTLSAVLFPILFAFTCPSSVVEGLSPQSLSQVCSSNCNCPIKKMEPVCFNSTTYFSSCLAGCRSQINNTHFGMCGCNQNMIASKGFCEQMCFSIYGFLVAFFIIKVIGSIGSVQFTQVLLRLINPKNKAVGMSIISLIFGICGFVLPPLAGSILDTACTHRNANKNGIVSHCLVYDNDKMRYLILGLAFVVQIPACIFYIFSWYWTPADYHYDQNNKNKNPDQINPELPETSDGPLSIQMTNFNNKSKNEEK